MVRIFSRPLLCSPCRAYCHSNCTPQVPLGKLFSFADKRDKIFMLVGTLAAAIQAW